MAELEQLAQLKAQGIITDEEFEAKKKQILGHLGARSGPGRGRVRSAPRPARGAAGINELHAHRCATSAGPRPPTRGIGCRVRTPDPHQEARDTPPEHRVSRGRAIAARLLVILGIVFLVVGLLSNFVKREALDNDNFLTPPRS